MARRFRIKKGDTVTVITGKDKGKVGEVLKVFREDERVTVSGVKVVKRHQKPSAANATGGVVEKELSIHISNVALVDPKSQKATRVGVKFEKDGSKVRIARRSGEVIQ